MESTSTSCIGTEGASSETPGLNHGRGRWGRLSPVSHTGISFNSASAPAQVRRLRAVALRAVEAYGLRSPRLRLINHGFNATFRVDADSKRFALRLNVNSHRSLPNIAAEVAWVEALARETSLMVPAPQARVDGAFTALVDAPEVGRALPATMFSWLPGSDLARRDDPRALYALGRATAELHRHGAQWSVPTGAVLPFADDVLMHQPPSFLDEAHPALSDERRAVFRAAHGHASRALSTVFGASRPHPLHFDLHTWNVKWVRGRLSVFDFDDCVFGVPIQDLATTVQDLRTRATGERLESALREGYESVSPWPPCSETLFDALLVGRELLLVNDLIRIENAKYQAFLAADLAEAEQVLRTFLNEGCYRPDRRPS
jgi:Ser/Thr protein kinase RdoA (MazF antagonist)